MYELNNTEALHMQHKRLGKCQSLILQRYQMSCRCIDSDLDSNHFWLSHAQNANLCFSQLITDCKVYSARWSGNEEYNYLYNVNNQLINLDF